MKIKTFDCVEMKRRGAEALQKKLNGKSPADELAFWKKGTEQLKKLQQKMLSQE